MNCLPNFTSTYICLNRFLNVKATLGCFNQDKALEWANSAIEKSSLRFVSSSTAHLPLIRTRARIKHSEILSDYCPQLTRTPRLRCSPFILE